MLDELNFGKLRISEFQSYIKKKPPSSYEAIAKTVAKCQPYLELFTSEFGQLLIKDMMPMVQDRIIAVVEGNANEELRIELKVMLNIFARWNKMIIAYNDSCDKVRKGGGNQ